MPVAKLIARLGLGTGILCAALVGLAEEISSWLPRSEIAFVSNRYESFDIFLLDIRHNIQHRLTDNNVDDEYPAWSPDGNQIAFVSWRDGHSVINVMDANGADGQLIYEGDTYPLRYLAWSPEGGRIAFSSQVDGDEEIYVLDLESHNVAQLTQNTAGDRYPCWSPDGDRIAFSSNRNGLVGIFLMNADGSHARALLDSSNDFNPSAYWSPDWSPDGSQLALTRLRAGKQLIYIASPPDTSALFSPRDASSDIQFELFQLTIFNPHRNDDTPAWSSDSRQIAFVSSNDRSFTKDIWMINADGTGLRRLTDHFADEVSPVWRP